MEEEIIESVGVKSPEINKVDLTKLKNPILVELIEAGLITEQGIRIQGMGMLVRKMEFMCDLQDKTNMKISFVEKAIRGQSSSVSEKPWQHR